MNRSSRKRPIFYAQSGGVTAVINATAQGVIDAAHLHRDRMGPVYAGANGILGALHEELIDTSREGKTALAKLHQTPGGAFGSCRFKLKDPTKQAAEFQRLFEVFAAHDIGYFFYNGGNDSQDTTHKIAEYSRQINYPLICLGLPKTIDNDLILTDNCPGFGSVAKYVAISTLEAGLDVHSMSKNSTKVFILEVMGRDAGWIAASSGLAGKTPAEPPHLILFPEIPFIENVFLEQVERCVKQSGYCVIVASEGLRDSTGQLLSIAEEQDAFGHPQLGGVAPLLAHRIQKQLGLKNHWAVADYLQRAARHIASKIDVEQAYKLGAQAVKRALKGETDVMLAINRKSNRPYRYQIETVPLEKVANQVKTLPRSFITSEGFGITPACRAYLLPLIQGEAYPSYQGGLPDYTRLKNHKLTKKTGDFP